MKRLEVANVRIQLNAQILKDYVNNVMFLAVLSVWLVILQSVENVLIVLPSLILHHRPVYAHHLMLSWINLVDVVFLCLIQGQEGFSNNHLIHHLSKLILWFVKITNKNSTVCIVQLTISLDVTCVKKNTFMINLYLFAWNVLSCAIDVAVKQNVSIQLMDS